MSTADSTPAALIADHHGRTIAAGAPLYFRLLGYVKPYWAVFAAGIAAMVCVGVVESYMPTLLQPLLDGAFVEQDPDVIATMPILLVSIALLRGIANFAAHVGLLWVAGKVVMDLRQEMFDRILTMPTRQFDNTSTGVLLSKVTFDVHRVMDACTHALIILVRDTVMVIGLLSWMLYLHWQLTLIVFAIVPVIVIVVRIVSKRLRRINLSMQDAMGQMTRILEEAITGHKLVKVFAGQRYESGRFNHTSNWVRRYEVKVQVTSQINVFISHTLIALALALIVYIATATPFGMESISVGTFGAIFAAMGMLSTPVKRLTKTNEQLQQGLAAAQSVFELIDKLPEQDDGKQTVQRLQGHVQLQGVNFSYPDQQETVLNGIDLDIAPGQTIALVGASGSGKTTLANLIPRFYPLEQGELSIDGVDIRDMPLTQLRDNIALVSQEVVLFNDTIAANIAYGAMSGASRDAIADAAKAAHAMEFIDTLPDGLDTIIGERGAKLSGGQRQRLAIARAFLKDAPILVLDEATSALDTETEKQVQTALESLRQGRTTIIIAHRLSTIERADVIVVMEQGNIVEQGKHEELMQRGGVYARLYKAQ